MLQIQEQYGLYSVKEHLAVGEERACCKAMDPFVGQDVILQLIKLPELGNGERVDEFIQRLDALAALNHPALAPIYDIGREADLCFYASEFYPAGRFSRQLTEQEGLEVLKQLTDALAYADKKGFEHGLFTAEEVFQNDAGQPVLIGFGIAELLNSLYGPEEEEPSPNQFPSLAQKQSFYSLGALFLTLVLPAEQQVASKVDQIVQLQGYHEKQLITALLGFAQEAITSYDELMRRLQELLSGSEEIDAEVETDMVEASSYEQSSIARSEPAAGRELPEEEPPSLDLSKFNDLDEERNRLQTRLDDAEHAKFTAEQKQLELERELSEAQQAVQGARQETLAAWDMVDHHQSQTQRPFFLILCGCLVGVMLAGGLITFLSSLLETSPDSEASKRFSIQRMPAVEKTAVEIPHRMVKPAVATAVEPSLIPEIQQPEPNVQVNEPAPQVLVKAEKTPEPEKEMASAKELVSTYSGSLKFTIDLAEELPALDKGKILAALDGWSRAWEKQRIDDYLGFYSSNFQPEGGQSRKEWQKSRKARLAKPAWIKVQLADLQISESSVDQVQVWLKQVYRSDTYGDQTIKAVEMVREGEVWRIQAERSYQEGG